MDYTLFDGVALGDAFADAAAPKPFRLFRTGENRLTRNGAEFSLTLTADELAAIAKYQHHKGEKIPLDSRHALFLAAERAGVSEREALRAVPQGVAALGFAALEKREDGLYATGIELTALGAELFRSGALRYYSPVVRGLDGRSPLRVTSIALDNVPALNNLEILAASGEEDGQAMPVKGGKKEVNMTMTEQALRRLLGDEALALSDTTDAAIASKIDALAAELPELRLRAARADELALAAEQEHKRQLIERAIRENRATNAEREGLMKLDVAWLDAELPKRAPNAVPADPLKPEEEEREEKTSLTPEEQAVADKLNLTAEEFLKSRKECEA